MKKIIPYKGNVQVCFNTREGDAERVHEQAIKIIDAIGGAGSLDIEAAGLLHLFFKACGVSQTELDLLKRLREENISFYDSEYLE
jgi:hypothetical protein